ncbi:MAG: aldo/keto reductase [Clostridia bacterium]|nr:aldo/keto reductase [Clostridia bacterium]
MKKIVLSNGLEVAPVALGAMNFGTTTSKEDAYRVLDAYVDMGGNFIDTSNNYAHWAGTGDESETLLGEWLRDRGCRDRVVIATKVGFDRHGKGAGLKKEQIEYWIDESLRKLGTDYVDLYYAHTDDMGTPMEETMETFHALVKKGKVRHLGGSNYDTWRFAEANLLAKEKKLTPYTVMQQKFTYLHPRADMAPKYIFNEAVSRERLRFLKEKDIPLVAYSCLAKGGYEVSDRIPADYIVGDRLEAVRAMAREKGVNTSALVVGWMVNLHRCEGFPRVIPLFASSRVEHFMDNLRGVELTLTDEELADLNRA